MSSVVDQRTKVKIEVEGQKVNLYVHGQTQTTLLINDFLLFKAWPKASRQCWFVGRIRDGSSFSKPIGYKK